MSKTSTPLLTNRPCPACAATERTVLYRQKFSQLSVKSMLSGYDVVTCQNCGCGYANNIPPQRWFDAYYREMSKYEFAQRDGQESPFDEQRFNDIADLLASFAHSKATRFFDFGSATGGLLHQLQKRGYENLLGLDPSPACAALADKLYGIRVVAPGPDDEPIAEAPFDFIIFVGVLEHLAETGPILQRLRAALAPGGLIFVEVPDALGFADVPDAPYQQFSVEHINFFSDVSLTRIMAGQGFAPIHVERSARDQSHGTSAPIALGVFQKSDDIPPFETFDAETEIRLQAYIDLSAEREARVEKAFAALADSQREIVVWGVGTHTLHLMETTRLEEANIVAYIDSNASYAGQNLRGVPILPPEKLRDLPQPIVISSRVFQKEIADQIENALGCPNEIIRLYDV